MTCKDCKGTGKYQPLIGPEEDCQTCGGDGGPITPVDMLDVMNEIGKDIKGNADITMDLPSPNPCEEIDM